MKKLFFLSFAILLLCSYVSAEEKNIVLIVNANSPLGTNISAEKIKDIYTGKIKFEGKTKLSPANHKEEKILEGFLGKFVGMTSTAYKNHWVKKVFSEGGSAPKIVETAGEMVKYVLENEGGIGYLWESDLTGKEEGIKRVTQ